MKVVAQRYAAALVDVALEQKNAEAVRAELAAFAALVTESADLRNFLSSPAVPRPQKQAVVEQLVARLGAGGALRNFLFVLIENRRTLLLPQIRDAFQELLHARLGITEAEVTSARELSAEERSALIAALERKTGKRIEARYALDPALIAGAQVRIGSTVYHGTVREQLNRIRARLAAE